MEKVDKELLLKDLCVRLPYGVKFKDEYAYEYDESLQEIHYIKDENIYTRTYTNLPYWIETIKPYLRPMSSMTEEEREELRREQIKDEQLFTDCIKNHPEMRGLIIPHFAANWCDKNMFDYCGLIEKGLAIAVTEENNPYKE